MWPFECVGPDGRVYFHFDNWTRFLAQRQLEYPPIPIHQRYQLTLIYPRTRLEEVFTPTGQVFHHDIQFYDPNWSVIFQPFPAHAFTADGDNSVILLVENNHANPWGERVVVMSDRANSGFENDARNFVYFQGKYWRILNAVDLSHQV